MRCEYPRGLRGPALEDAVLALVWLALLLLVDLPAGVRAPLLAAIPIVLVWGAVSLHFPSCVEIDDAGVAFGRYGRVHRFEWRDVRCVRVRRFVLRDRVLVRMEPSGGAWRGRYWILASMPRFDRIVQALEQRRNL
jgi:hypothetical protein